MRRKISLHLTKLTKRQRRKARRLDAILEEDVRIGVRPIQRRRVPILHAVLLVAFPRTVHPSVSQSNNHRYIGGDGDGSILSDHEVVGAEACPQGVLHVVECSAGESLQLDVGYDLPAV